MSLASPQKVCHASKADTVKSLSPHRVVGHWNRLSREMITVPTLPEFKKDSDNTLRHTM